MEKAINDLKAEFARIEAENARFAPFWKLVEKWQAKTCFTCSFGWPEVSTPHGFWKELWECVEALGIDSQALRIELATKAAQGDECVPYMVDRLARRVRELMAR